MDLPLRVAVDSQGLILVIDANNNRILIFDSKPQLAYKREFLSKNQIDQIDHDRRWGYCWICIDETRERLYVAVLKWERDYDSDDENKQRRSQYNVENDYTQIRKGEVLVFKVQTKITRCFKALFHPVP